MTDIENQIDQEMSSDNSAPSQRPTSVENQIDQEMSSQSDDVDSKFNQKTDQSQYSTPGQQVLTGVEGVAHGVLGPLSPIATEAELGAHELGLDTALGIDTSAEAQTGRAEANPWISGAGKVAGLGALTYMTGGLLSASSLGGAVLKNAIAGGLIQTGDEISKALLGQGDPEDSTAAAITHIAGATLLGGATGGVFNLIGKGLQGVADEKFGETIGKKLVGLHVAQELQKSGLDPSIAETVPERVQSILNDAGLSNLTPKDIQPGIDNYNLIHRNLTGIAGHATIGLGSKFISHAIGAGDLLSDVIGTGMSMAGTPTIDKFVGKGIGIAGKYVGPAIFRAASEGNLQALSTAAQYGKNVSKGALLLDRAADSLFNIGQSYYNPLPDDKMKKKLNDIIENGGPQQQLLNQQAEDTQNPQGFAEGGQVQKIDISHEPDHMGSTFPEQNIILNTVKGRVYNYLNSLRPVDTPETLPFDVKKDRTEQHKTYNRALDIASSPLSVVDRIKDGSIGIDHMKHLTQMYPEIYRALSKRITKRIVENQIDEKRPPFKIRQGLSLFLGSPMESTFLPQNIMAAQGVFKPKPMPGQSQQIQTPKKKTKSKSSLSEVSKSYKTPGQSAEEDSADRD